MDMQHLDLSMYPEITDQKLREITEAAPNLREFCIANQPDTKQLTSDGTFLRPLPTWIKIYIIFD